MVALAAAVSLVLASVVPATAQDGSPLGDLTVQGLAEFLSAQTDLRVVTDFGPPYQFADAPTEAAQRDDDFAMFDSVFSGVFVFPDGLEVDCGFTAFQWSTFCAEGFSGVDSRQPYVVFGGVTGGVIPESGPADAIIQYSFPFTYTGAIAFEPLDQFPGDTWQWTSYQPWVQADLGGGWTYSTSQWDGTRFLAPVGAGFGWVNAEEFYIAVPTSEIGGLSSQAEAAIGDFENAVADDLAEFTEDNIADAFAGLSWASAVHIHTGDFGVTNPSKIQAGPPKPHGPSDLFRNVSDTRPWVYPRQFPQKPDLFDYDQMLPAPAHLLEFGDEAGITWDFSGIQYGWEPPAEAFDRIVLEQFLLSAELPGGGTAADALGFDMPQTPCAELGAFLNSSDEVACNDAMFDWFGQALTGDLGDDDGLFTVTFDFATAPSVDGERFVVEAFFDWLDGGFQAEGASSGADFRFGLSNDGGVLVANSRRWDSGTDSWSDDPLEPVGYQIVGDYVTLWLTRSMFGEGNPQLGVVASWTDEDATDETAFKTDHGVLETGGICPFVAEESFWTAVFPVTEPPPSDDGATDGSEEPTDGDSAEQPADDGGFPWLIPLGLGLVLIVAGGWMFVTSRQGAAEDCEKEKAAWDAALAHLKEVRGELDEYKLDLDENVANINQTRKELKKLLDAKRTSGSVDGGTVVHPLREGLIDAEGLDQVITETRRLVETYEEHLPDRQARFDRALIRFDAARQREQDAREAYAECIGATLSAPIEANDPPPPLEEEPAPSLDEPARPTAPRPPVIEFDFDEPQPAPPTEPRDAEPPEPVTPEPAPMPTPGGVVGEDGPPTPSPGLAPREADDAEQFCDWAFYVSDGGTPKLIRPPGPGGHECCRYVLTITSKPGFSISNGGITPDASGDAHPRDTSVIAHNAYKGADAWGRAQVRTWPEGAIAAMFGEGWPTVDPSPDEWPPAFDSQPGDRPDVAAFTLRPDQTDITVEFTDGCGDARHTYSHTATSRVYVQADQECTNRRHQPECPVELSVTGEVRAAASGSMSYPIIDPGAVVGSDPDELPNRIVSAPDGAARLEASLDSHDHVSREKSASRLTLANSDTSPNQVQDTWHGRWTHLLSLSAGLRVPESVRAATDRVTARITGDIAHTLDLTGSASPDHSSGACECGNDDCRCAPEFRLLVDGGDATIEISGRRIVSLYRPDDPGMTPGASREVIWSTSSPSSFGLPRPEPDRPSPPDIDLPI